MKKGAHKDLAIPFGRYKGELIADLPCSYLSYLMDQDWFISKFGDLAEQIYIEQEYRKKFNIEIKE